MLGTGNDQVGSVLQAGREAAEGCNRGRRWKPALASRCLSGVNYSPPVPMQGPEGTTPAEGRAQGKQAQSASLTQEVAKLCTSSLPKVCAGSNGS